MKKFLVKVADFFGIDEETAFLCLSSTAIEFFTVVVIILSLAVFGETIVSSFIDIFTRSLNFGGYLWAIVKIISCTLTGGIGIFFGMLILFGCNFFICDNIKKLKNSINENNENNEEKLFTEGDY